MRALKYDTDPAIALVPQTESEARQALERLLDDCESHGDAAAFDFETTGADREDTARVLALASTRFAVLLLVEAQPELVEHVRWFFEECMSRGVILTAHNSRFDAWYLEKLTGIDGAELLRHVEDTMILANLVEHPRKQGKKDASGRPDKDLLVQMAERRAGTPLPLGWMGLKSLTDDWLPVSLAKDGKEALEIECTRLGLTSKTFWREIPSDNAVYLLYAAADALSTSRLHKMLRKPAVMMTNEEVLTREHAMSRVAYRVHRRGFLMDVERITTERADASKDDKMKALKAELLDRFGIENPNSGKDIADAIEREIGEPPTKKDADGNDKPSTAKDVLKLLPGECAKKVLEYRALAKLESTYGAGWLDKYGDDDGYIHPTMNPLGSSTGRFTTATPSMLNVPSSVRDYIIAPDGYVFVQSDLSAVEPRIGAADAGDPTMRADLAAGKDPYAVVAESAFGKDWTRENRNASKPTLLGRMYGRSAKSLAYEALQRDPDGNVEVMEREADRIMRSVDRRWSKLREAAYREGARTKAGRTRVQLASGRCISLDPVGARDTFNALVQGTGRELLVDAAMRLIERGYEENLWLCIHDEWILLVPEADAEQARRDLEECMTSTYRGIPIITEAKILGNKWTKG